MTSIDKSNKKGYTGLWNVSYVGKLRYWKQSFEKHIGSFTVNLLNFNQSAKPHKGRKVRDMFSSFNALRGRLIIGVSSVIILASLAACGGGGSSTDPVPDKKAASVSFEGTTTCTVPIGSKECPVIVAWNAQNVNSLVVTVDSVTVGTTTQGKSTAVVGTGEKVVTAFDGTTVVGTTKITITCDGGMTPIEGVCKAAKTPVDSVVTMASKSGYIPQVIHIYSDGTKETLTPTVEIGFPIGNCLIEREVKAVSRALDCADGQGVRHSATWNKALMKITAYDGTSGALPPLTDKTFWLDVSAANQGVLMTFFVQSTNGTFFVDGNEGATVFFRPKDGTPDFAVTDKLGTIKALTGF